MALKIHFTRCLQSLPRSVFFYSYCLRHTSQGWNRKHNLTQAEVGTSESRQWCFYVEMFVFRVFDWLYYILDTSLYISSFKIFKSNNKLYFTIKYNTIRFYFFSWFESCSSGIRARFTMIYPGASLSSMSQHCLSQDKPS